MKIVFVTISSLPYVGEHSISLDLLREFQKNNHKVYIVCSCDGKEHVDTFFSEEQGFQILRVKIGKNKNAGLIEKGMTQLLLPYNYISAIKKYLSNVKFDLILYPTPPVTHVSTVNFIKKRDGAKSYLLLKDIFPQNAVDIGMMKKRGWKGLLYKYFRDKEKKLYELSDYIGCMSQGNVEYVLKHNLEVDKNKIEICPNAVEPIDMSVSNEDKIIMREKYGIPKDKIVFVYGGNLGKPQGIPFLIECLKNQKNNEEVFFLIVGDGTEYEKLQCFVQEENPKNVKLMSRLPKEDYDRMVGSCDVGMIFLDHRFTIPNFPSRVLSYMQAKIPVLAVTDINTDIGKVIVKGKFGWWCESNDVNSFQNIVEYVINSERGILGRKGWEYLNRYYSSENGFKIIINHFKNNLLKENSDCIKRGME